VRGFVFGLIVIPFLVVSVLSMRPGGLRAQLKNVFRRLRLVLVLGGIYFVGAAVLKVALGTAPSLDYAIGGLAVALAVMFFILGQDRPLES
jgi:hypothetical protein